MSNYIKKGDLVYNFKEFFLYKLLKHETSNGYKYYGYKLYYIDNDIVKDITSHLQTSKKYGWRGDKKENATIVANAVRIASPVSPSNSGGKSWPMFTMLSRIMINHPTNATAAANRNVQALLKFFANFISYHSQ